MKMKNLKILLSTILIGTAFIGCSSTPDEKTVKSLAALYITSPINNLNYSIILYGKNRCKKIITQRVV